MIEMMLEVMRLGLKHGPSSGVKLELKELRSFYIGKSN